MHVAELHLDEQGAGAQLRIHLLEPIRLAHRLERCGDPADVVEAEREVVQQHELADAVALRAGQRDRAPRRSLGLGVLIGGVEEHAEVGVVLDLARPVVEPQQPGLGVTRRVHALGRAVLQEERVGQCRDQVQVKGVGRSPGFGRDDREPGARLGLGRRARAALGERIGACEVRVAFLQRRGGGAGERVERLVMRVAAEAGLQIGPMRPLQQGERRDAIRSRPLADPRRQQQQRALLLRPPRRGSTIRRRDQRRQRLQLFAAGEPVLRHPGRLGAAVLEKVGHLDVQSACDRCRHRVACRFEDQVVGEGAVVQDLGRLELAPGVGQVERAHAEDVRRQFRAEVGAGDRSASRQLDGQTGEPADALLDHARDVACGRQPPPPRRRQARPPCCRRLAPASASRSRAGTAGCRRCAGRGPARAVPSPERRRRANRAALRSALW